MAKLGNFVYVAMIVVIIILIGVIYLATNNPSGTPAATNTSGINSAYNQNQTAPTEVQSGDDVEVYYTGKFTNGTVFDTNVNNGRPTLNFTAGASQVIPGFDNAVIGMKLNETKTVTIPANDAYGPVNTKLIISVPLSKFGNQTVKVGMQFTQTTAGKQAVGTITQVNSTNATIDFNPPLAGQTLVFTITVVGIHKP